MGIRFRHPPADGEHGDEPRPKGLALRRVPEESLQQLQAHFSALGEAGQDQGPAAVLVIEIPAEGGGNVGVGHGLGLLPLRLGEPVGAGGHLAIVGGVEPPHVLIDALLHVQGTDEPALELVVQVVGVSLAPGVHQGADEEHVHVLVLAQGEVGPGRGVAVVGPRRLRRGRGLGLRFRRFGRFRDRRRRGRNGRDSRPSPILSIYADADGRHQGDGQDQQAYPLSCLHNPFQLVSCTASYPSCRWRRRSKR